MASLTRMDRSRADVTSVFWIDSTHAHELELILAKIVWSARQKIEEIEMAQYRQAAP